MFADEEDDAVDAKAATSAKFRTISPPCGCAVESASHFPPARPRCALRGFFGLRLFGPAFAVDLDRRLVRRRELVGGLRLVRGLGLLNSLLGREHGLELARAVARSLGLLLLGPLLSLHRRELLVARQ